MGSIMGCTLVEIQDMPYPHLYFRLDRFAPIDDFQDVLDEVIESELEVSN